jgi:hypothetical protein
MEIGFWKEVGINSAVAVFAFGWIYIQPPLPEQLRSPKAAMQDVTRVKPLQVTEIPKVEPVKPADIDIKVEPAGLSTTSQSLSTPDNLLEVTATSLKMRSAPSSSSDLIDVYARGSRFEKLGEDGKWIQVRSADDGTAGWMFADFLQAVN